MLSRRALLGAAAASFLVPGRARGAPVGGRKFVFVFCPGGWDVTMLFAPVFNDGIDHYVKDQPGQIGDIPFTDAPSRPSVRRFLEAYGDRTALLNGIEVPSVAHDVCTKWAMCGDSRASRDDWVSIIAGHADPELLLPNVHISGPIFPRDYTGASVRVGSNGQLAALLSGRALEQSATPVERLPQVVVPLQDDLVARRLERWTASRADPEGRAVAEQERAARERSLGLVEHVPTLSGNTDDLPTALRIASGCLEAGLSRTAIVGYGGGGNGMWDTHNINDFQDGMFELLFDALVGLLDNLAAAPGDLGGTLLDETVLCVMSEMGRTPKKNAAGGKDHWTWTSALVAGAGVRGGRTYGGWTDTLAGVPISLDSGDPDQAGTGLLPGHLGATLLALADIDPAAWLDPREGEPIRAMIED